MKHCFISLIERARKVYSSLFNSQNTWLKLAERFRLRFVSFPKFLRSFSLSRLYFNRVEFRLKRKNSLCICFDSKPRCYGTTEKITQILESLIFIAKYSFAIKT